MDAPAKSSSPSWGASWQSSVMKMGIPLAALQSNGRAAVEGGRARFARASYSSVPFIIAFPLGRRQAPRFSAPCGASARFARAEAEEGVGPRMRSRLSLHFPLDPPHAPAGRPPLGNRRRNSVEAAPPHARKRRGKQSRGPPLGRNLRGNLGIQAPEINGPFSGDKWTIFRR